MLASAAAHVAHATSLGSPSGGEFLIIVHADNPETSITREQLTQAFFKRTTRWSTGQPIRPVDLRPDSPTRSAFSDKVLKRSVVAVRTYWQQRIFSGRELPPPELETDAAVLNFVQNSSGSIGYVSVHTKLNAVKVISVQ
jgi:ABC-type phosphate transport system substrate-binding protein